MKWKLSKFTEVVNVFDKEDGKQISLIFNTRSESFSFLPRKYFAHLLRLMKLGQLSEKQFSEIKDFIAQEEELPIDSFRDKMVLEKMNERSK